MVWAKSFQQKMNQVNACSFLGWGCLHKRDATSLVSTVAIVAHNMTVNMDYC